MFSYIFDILGILAAKMSIAIEGYENVSAHWQSEVWMNYLKVSKVRTRF